ncbi:unnamed protein product, partial [marine sediment metagenome]
LKLIEGECSAKCEKCSYINSCVTTSCNKIWSLTEKGFKLAEKS